MNRIGMTAVGLCLAAFGAQAQGFEVAGKTVTMEQSLRDMLPPDVIEKNQLVFATDAAGPPRTFVDERGQVAGVIPDLAMAIGAVLGVEVVVDRNSFDAQVPGVQSGRFDFTTDTGDFPHRRDVLDMIDYYRAGYLYLVRTGNPEGVTNDELTQCGLRVGVSKGTTQETLVEELSARCEEAGHEPVDIQTFQNILLPVPLSAGRVDVVWENTSTGYMVAQETPNMFEVAGDPVFSAYVAFGISKKRTQLRDAVQAATQHLMDEGVYGAIFEEWGQGELMMDYISINSDVCT